MSRTKTVALLPFLLIGVMAGNDLAGDTSEASPDAIIAAAVQRARVDIEAAKKRLVETRERVARERVKKQTELVRLEDEVSRLRSEWRRHARNEDTAGGRLRDLQDESQRLNQLLDGAWKTLVEARRNTETRFSLLDRKIFEKCLAKVDGLLKRKDDSRRPEDCDEWVLALLIDHVRDASRIRRTSGTAIDDEGREQTGVFIQVGGIGVLFAGRTESRSSGLMRLQHGSAEPHVWSVAGEDERQAILSLADGKASAVPIDISGGAALRSMQAKRTLSEEVRAGGPVMVPILALALICFCVGLRKALHLWRIPASVDSRVQAFIRNLAADRQEAENLAERARGPLRHVLKQAAAHAGKPRDQLEEVLHGALLAESTALESKLSILSVGAAIAPLLGLLGTVTGMIHTFRLISVFGTGDARMLSGGISEALVTTEAGLIVAIPLLLLHAFLSRRVRTIADGLEKGALAILNECPATLPARREVS